MNTDKKKHCVKDITYDAVVWKCKAFYQIVPPPSPSPPPWGVPHVAPPLSTTEGKTEREAPL